ncbi:hypothetical protein C0995_011865 [Termitomyces sp. Mi166|nr:hypothetical protein C0995_011865 [Termitomyces sp. Mi166\
MDAQVVSLASSSNGRLSGKSWKTQKSATVYVLHYFSKHLLTFPRPRRSRLPQGVKTKSWDDRMRKTQQALAIKKLEAELKEEKQVEIQRRRQITQERKKAAEERQRLEEDKAKMGARKAARLRRKAGRTKKING